MDVTQGGCVQHTKFELDGRDFYKTVFPVFATAKMAKTALVALLALPLAAAFAPLHLSPRLTRPPSARLALHPPAQVRMMQQTESIVPSILSWLIPKWRRSPPTHEPHHRFSAHLLYSISPLSVFASSWPSPGTACCPHVQDACREIFPRLVGGGVRIHPENARISGRRGVQYVAQCVACAALSLVVWQEITNISFHALGSERRIPCRGYAGRHKPCGELLWRFPRLINPAMMGLSAGPKAPLGLRGL